MTLLYAVLTGDLIGATKASPTKVEATMANITATARFLTEFTGEDTRFTRYRGDGWQMVLSPSHTLRALALILAGLRADRQTLSTRIAVGIGTIDSLGTTDLRDAGGSAFEYSGQALDSLTRDQALTLASEVIDGEPTRATRLRGAIEWSEAALLPLFEFIADRWSPPQAEAMVIALRHDAEKQADMARKLGISRQALNLRLTGAGYRPILSSIKLAEQYFGDTPG